MAKNTDMSSWFFNENFNGVPDDFFDGQSLANDVPLDLFDISSVPVDENGEVEDWEVEFESIELPPPDALASLSSAFCAQGYVQANNKSQVSLNRVPKGLDSRRPLHQSNSSSSKGSCVIQTSSPTSVLDSNSSTSNSHPVHFNPKTYVPMKRRSKHPRIPSSKQWSNSDLFQRTSKRKEKRKTQSSVSSDANRKCTHCQATETPQWREGPQGPKTLCNACGVRYRSGRLFPEYRPASSPTFVPSVHSNSHRKVAELRKKASLETPLVVPQQETKTCDVSTR